MQTSQPTTGSLTLPTPPTEETVLGKEPMPPLGGVVLGKSPTPPLGGVVLGKEPMPPPEAFRGSWVLTKDPLP